MDLELADGAEAEGEEEESLEAKNARVEELCKPADPEMPENKTCARQPTSAVSSADAGAGLVVSRTDRLSLGPRSSLFPADKGLELIRCSCPQGLVRAGCDPDAQGPERGRRALRGVGAAQGRPVGLLRRPEGHRVPVRIYSRLCWLLRGGCALPFARASAASSADAWSCMCLFLFALLLVALCSCFRSCSCCRCSCWFCLSSCCFYSCSFCLFFFCCSCICPACVSDIS